MNFLRLFHVKSSQIHIKHHTHIKSISDLYQIRHPDFTSADSPQQTPISSLSPPPAKGLLPVATDWKEPGPSGTPGPPSPCGFPVGIKSLL